MSVDNTEVVSVNDLKYNFNINTRLNDLLLKSLIQTGLINKDNEYIFDYDNQLIATEKYDIEDEQWKSEEIDFQRCYVTTLPFESFLSECGYRLVVQRTLVQTDQPELFGEKYIYRCILTNDWEQSEKDIILFYNRRGETEKQFDVMNNDFGWGHLPCSFMRQNTVFMILMCIIRNYYIYYVGKIANCFGNGIQPTSRIKRFVYRFMSVSFKWVLKGRQWRLRLFTDLPYDKLVV